MRPGVADRRRRPFPVRRLAFIVLAVIAAFSLATARLFVLPAQGAPARVDAIVMLAGSGDRLGVALRLATEHQAPVLVVSEGWEGYGGPCPPRPPGVRLICFEPNPGNTRGEAEFVSRLALRYRWRSVVLVTTPGQDTRARILMRRCFGGSIYVIATRLPLNEWPYEIAYAWGSLFKALALVRACLHQQPRRGGERRGKPVPLRHGGNGKGESAGMNRSGGGDGRALRRRASEPTAAPSYASRFREGLAKRWQGHVQAGLLSREIIFPGCQHRPLGGRRHHWQRYRELLAGPARSENQGMHRTSRRENRKTPYLARPGDHRAGRPGNAEAVRLG